MTRRPRGLHPDERELWAKVAATAQPLHPAHPKKAEPAPKTKPKRIPLEIAPFRIGEAARTDTALAATAGAPLTETPVAPIRMDRKAHARMTRGKTAPDARLDLHGLTLAEAQPELIRFILSAHRAGLRLVLVITGKGKRGDDRGPIPARTGVLRHHVPHWLAAPPLSAAVLQVASAHLRHGGEGAYYVYLRKPPEVSSRLPGRSS